MATILRTPIPLLPSSRLCISSLENPKSSTLVTFSSSKQRIARSIQLKLCSFYVRKSPRIRTFMPICASGETAKTQQVEEVIEKEVSEDEAVVDGGENDAVETEEKAASVVMASLQSYKEALANDDQSTISEIESFLQSIEDERNTFANKVAILASELSTERDRVLRISADFDNFRKRTERERLSLMTNVQGEVVESLLPVLDNFERAKDQIKVETEGEEKINNSYQSIYKQFLEVLTSLGVEAVETVGTAFDPLLHEAIMREESTEYEEGIIIQEFRKGYKLGERLLRPAMVKVSAGPGPTKPAGDPIPPANDEDSGETDDASDA